MARVVGAGEFERLLLQSRKTKSGPYLHRRAGRCGGFEGGDAFDAGDAGQADVEEHDVGRCRFSERDEGFFASAKTY